MSMSTGHKEKRQERIMRAFELRKAGKTYREIGDALGYSHEMARKDIQGVLQGIAEETIGSAKEVLSIELARLDTLQYAVWSMARTGDISCINTILKIMERRAKLLGLDISRNVNVMVTAEDIAKMSDEELHDIISTISTNAGTS